MKMQNSTLKAKSRFKLSSILTPSILLMNRLSFLQKFTLVGLIFIIPSVLSASMFVADIQEKLHFSKGELAGVAPIKQLVELQMEVEKHRILTIQYANGQSSMKDQMDEQQEIVDDKLLSMVEWEEKYNEAYGTSDRWKALNMNWYNIKTKGFRADYVDIIDVHKRIIQDIEDIWNQIATESNMNLDSESEVYYLLNIASQLRDQTERMSILVAVGRSVLNRGDITDFDKELLTNELDEKGINEIKLSIEEIDNDRLLEQLLDINTNYLQNTYTLMDMIKFNMIESDSLSVNKGEFESISATALSANEKIYQGILDTLEGFIDSRISDYSFQKNVLLTVVIGFVLLSIYLFISFYISIRKTVQQLSIHSGEMSSGNLTVRTVLETRDELRTVCESFNGMAESFQQMITVNLLAAHEISVSAEQLKNSSSESTVRSEELASALNLIAQGARDQLISARRSVQQISEMSSGIESITDNTSTVAEAAIKAADEAMSGDVSIRIAVEQMEQIYQSMSALSTMVKHLKERSVEIGQIINEITDISKKTNMLALNAGIEAARAGVHGKGFTVVANEVRRLSDQSRKAALRISETIQDIQHDTDRAADLMGSGMEEVEKGKTMVGQTGKQFRSVVQSIDDVAGLIQEISATCEQFSAGTEQVSQEIKDMLTIAQTAATSADRVSEGSLSQLAIAEQNKVASEQLNELSDKLQQSMNKFIVG